MSITEPPFVDGLPVLARRILPPARRTGIPTGMEALLVRDGEPQRVLPAGEHTVRRFFQSTPELYLFRPDGHFLPLWITSLATAGGRSAALSWRISVQVADARRLWEGWLRHRPDEWIAVPAELISTRLADAAQTLVGRYSLDDLRGDPTVRREVAGKLSLLIKQQLDPLGLEFAEQFDPQQLRFLTDADQAQAARERAALQRALEDERLSIELNRIDNVDTLAYRLQEAAAAGGSALDGGTARDLAQAALGMPGLKPAAALDQALGAPPLPATPASAPQLPTVEHRGRHHVWRRLSLLVLIVSLLSALALAAIAYLRPELLAAETQRNQVIAGVAGIAILGVLVSWVIDQVIRWEAQRSAERLLIEANLDSDEAADGRLEARHILMLVSALAGIGVAAAALWLPEHVNWLRVVGSGAGMLAAAFAIRIDWLHNVNRANQVMANAQRRIASAQLGAAERRRGHVKLQASLSAELEIVRQRLDDSAGLAYRTLDDRALNRRLRALESSVKQQMRQVRDLEQAGAERSTDEWAAVDEHMDRLRAAVTQAAGQSVRLAAFVQERKRDEIAPALDKLEQSVHNLQDELARWTATAA